MPTAITGIVTNGVIVPSSPLPDGSQVEVTVLSAEKSESPLSSAPALDEFDCQLDELSGGLSSLPSLPPDFGRADIYPDHP
jgi:hypothetical protein